MADGRPAGVASVVGGVGEAVTLVEGTSFVISSAGGDIEAGDAQGLFWRDTRYLSCWRLRIDEQAVQPLAVVATNPFAGTFLGRTAPRDGHSDSTLFVIRDRYVGDGMREDVALRNLGSEAAACTVTIEYAADFAHLFEVKENRVVARGEEEFELDGQRAYVRHSFRERHRQLSLHLPEGATATSEVIAFDVVVPAKGEWRACIEVELEMDGDPAELRYHCGDPVEFSTPARRLRRWESTTPRVTTADEGVNHTLGRSIPDLGSLRVFDPDDPEHAVIAAGAPWFMTLFGRDSIITSWMTLVVDPSLAVATLRTLARYQGSKVDARTEEQPGRILHEIRSGMSGITNRGIDSIYYGSVDSTPLFVMLLGELHDWGFDPGLIDELLPNADRALEWIEQFGDRDDDGFVEYQRATNRGLVNQGWKDSFDGINFANGRIAEPPIALCEVQGYVYSAYRARARIARSRGDQETAARCDERARALKARFNEAFWLDDGEYLAVGLDGDKRQIDALTSNIGHCLWAGIVDERHAGAIAAHLVSEEMLSGWGVRTLASTMGAYNPVSYHNGSVWPHDSAICATGLMRYRFVSEAQTVATAVLDAADEFDGRLPELLCGFGRREFAAPVGYPTSCSPQAWASATPFSLLRTLLGLNPSCGDGIVWLAPQIPESLGTVRVEQVPIGKDRATIEATGETATISNLNSALRVLTEPRPIASR